MNTLSYYEFFGARVPEPPVRGTFDLVENQQSDAHILSAIYSLDPVTKLPTGDIAMFVSDKTSPEVRMYIANMLMSDTSGNALPKLPDGLDETTAFSLERKSVNGNLETLSAWRDRVSRFYQDEVDNLNMLARQVQEPKSNSDVPSE